MVESATRPVYQFCLIANQIKKERRKERKKEKKKKKKELEIEKGETFG